DDRRCHVFPILARCACSRGREMDMRRLWVVLVLEARRLRFAPEVYPTQLRAEREAHRWGWFLGGGEESRIYMVDEHHWRVGRTHVRLVPVPVREIPLAAELWVGVCWGIDGNWR